MKKRILAAVLSLTLVATLFAGCGNGGDGGEEKLTIKMTLNGTDSATDAKTANKYAELVAEASNGNIEIKPYPNDQLAGGNQSKGIEMLAQGTTEMAAYSNGVLGNLDEKLLTSNIPWSFSDYDEVKSYWDGTGGEYAAKLLADKGITYLGAIHNGFRQLTNSKHEVKTPEDVKGLKIRVPGGEVYLDTFRAMGADPVAMSWSEVFTALQQGTLDGQENGFNTSNSNKIYEVNKYATEWNYIYDAYLLVANTEKFSAYSEENQKILREQGKIACDWGCDYVKNGDEDIKKDWIENKGVQVYTPTEEEMQAFKDAVKSVQDKFKAQYGEEACIAWGLND